MEGNQQFCLKWNNYHVNIANSFDSLRVDEDFVDVTLACDGFHMKAHRMVLSACSPFFRQLLKSNPHPHPIVILRDVSQQNMVLLLDFMYHGEVNVAQEQLAEFLKVAELLKVKGLADDKREEGSGSNGQSSRVATPSASPAASGAPPAEEPPPAKRPRLPSLVHATAATPASQAPPLFDPSAVKREAAESHAPGYAPAERGGDEHLRVLPQTSLVGEEGGALLPAEVSIEDVEQTLPAEASRGQSVTGAGPSSLPFEASSDPLSLAAAGLTAAEAAARAAVLQRCPHCPAVFSSKSTIKDHMARVHFPVPVQCPLCGKRCANQGVLRVHRSRVHRQRGRATPRDDPRHDT
ncbi:zinc finger and BTB domain-containing protein 12-like isoform X2 [Pollicipes pollicipes]|uniref:zinc finger and BTB domain-containing protein 12-like isoform X2 n=1 Tax=Pollicipes pollicipes TaxID=41117 RepID=UPI0018855895|nr:zinc finger and BTB domain-containing protein 12-like isoform X2 [Pollicipes pollicipes]